MIRRFQLFVIAAILLIAAFSTELEFLFYLVYLSILVIGGSYILTRLGHFRVEPLQIRTGDPFGFFEASASVGQGVAVVVYPRIDKLPLWRLPAASIEGSHAAPERTLQTSPLATAVRPYAPGDAFNRIHWKSTARHGEIQVKEFELEQTADAWIFLDLERAVQGGRGEESTVEVAV